MRNREYIIEMILNRKPVYFRTNDNIYRAHCESRGCIFEHCVMHLWKPKLGTWDGHFVKLDCVCAAIQDADDITCSDDEVIRWTNNVSNTQKGKLASQ